jgi:hypothetical protein
MDTVLWVWHWQPCRVLIMPMLAPAAVDSVDHVHGVAQSDESPQSQAFVWVTPNHGRLVYSTVSRLPRMANVNAGGEVHCQEGLKQ